MDKKQVVIQLTLNSVYFFIMVGVFIYGEIPILIGKDLFLPARLYDPPDMMRGNYLRLWYDISSLPRNISNEEFKREQKVYVYLDEHGNPVKLSRNLEKLHSPFSHVIRGKIGRVWSDSIRIDYGLEAYFTSPEIAKRLEERWDELKLIAHIKTTPWGDARLYNIIEERAPLSPN
ncbi:MAG: GDYXXLXY domain-containing protein [Deltaproteobacteria bacterium]|nr:GDYXXLXY domain-containing protein [Deltaproteobacteria bacterium]